jgi:two-component sensor histidine kinase
MTNNSGLMGDVFESQKRLLDAGDVDAEISDALARVGMASDIDRAYVFSVERRNNGTHVASQRYEWVREGISPQIDNPDLQEVPLEEAGYGRWVRLLSDYLPVFGLVEEFPAEEQPLLTVQSILSLLVIPIFADDELWGFVGFDDCRRRKVWTRSDVDLLLSLSIAIGARVTERTGDDGEDSIETQAANYVTAVQSIIQLKDVTGSSRPLSDLLEQSRARIRALVAAHRFLMRSGDGKWVNVEDFMHYWEKELRLSLDECRQRDLRLRTMSEPFSFPRKLALNAGLIIHELLLAYSCGPETTEDFGEISIGVHKERGTAVVRLRLDGADEEGAHRAPDPLGLVLVRRMTQGLDGNFEAPSGDAAARVVIPIGGAESEE